MSHGRPPEKLASDGWRCGDETLICDLAIVVFSVPATALGEPPANDSRAFAERISPPATITGTTSDSTVEADEPATCQMLRGSLFYEFRASSKERLVARPGATGDLDATVDVFLRTRSQLGQVACEVTDRGGNAALEFVPAKGETYLIRVGQRANSDPGGFRLVVLAPEPPPRGPGALLHAGGAGGLLDSLQHTSDAYSYAMQAGRSDRVNVAARACVTLEVFAPGTHNFANASRVASTGCDGYVLFTPGAGGGGRYSILVEAQSRRNGDQRYHLQIAPVGVDDTAPGVPLPNLTNVRGSLRGNAVDTLDLYRFSVARRSALELSLRYDGSGTAQVSLLGDNGRRLGGGETDLSRRLSPGRYYVAVRTRDGGAGHYVLRRVSRTITSTRTSINGTGSAQSAPGQSGRIAAAVTPGATGLVAFTIERFDPLAGWQFFRQVRSTATGGSAGITFTPSAEGRWRAKSMFEGTRIAAPSRSGYAMVPPLTGYQQVAWHREHSRACGCRKPPADIAARLAPRESRRR